jgi:hypothetical protein
MAIIKIWTPESAARALSVDLYLAAGEERTTAALIGFRDDLRRHGVEPRVLKRNPITPGDIGRLFLDVFQKHGEAIGTAILSSLTMWLKQKNGRRIEIERAGLKVKASSAAELKKALDALHGFDEATFTLNKAAPPKLRRAKTRALKGARRSK